MPDLAFFGAGNVWVDDISVPGRVQTQLEQAHQLGLGAIRAGVRGDFLPAPENASYIGEAETLLRLCRNADGGPFSVLFDLRSPDPHPYTPEQIYAIGLQWGNWLAALATTDPELADLVVGFSLQNAWCNKIVNAYEEVINSTDPPDYEAAEAAATAEAEAQTNVIVHFARAIRDTYPAAWRLPAGLPSNPAEQPYCLPLLTGHFFPDNGTPPVLNAVGIHWYRGAADFDIALGPPMTVTPKPPTFTALVDALLSGAGLPVATPVFVQEQNVKQTTFGWDPTGGSETPAFEAAQKALTAQTDAMFGDVRVRWVGPFSPWNTGANWLIQVVYEDLPGDWILTPAGYAVQHYVPPTP